MRLRYYNLHVKYYNRHMKCFGKPLLFSFRTNIFFTVITFTLLPIGKSSRPTWIWNWHSFLLDVDPQGTFSHPGVRYFRLLRFKILSSLIFTSGSVMRTIGKSCFADLGWKDLCLVKFHETDNFGRIDLSIHFIFSFEYLVTQKYPTQLYILYTLCCNVWMVKRHSMYCEWPYKPNHK